MSYLVDALKFDPILVAQAINDLHKTADLRKRQNLETQVNIIVEQLLLVPNAQQQQQQLSQSASKENITAARKHVKFELTVNIAKSVQEEDLDKSLVYHIDELKQPFVDRKVIMLTKLYRADGNLERKQWKLLLRQKTMVQDLLNLLMQKAPHKYPQLSILCVGEDKSTLQANSVDEKTAFFSTFCEALVKQNFFKEVDAFKTLYIVKSDGGNILGGSSNNNNNIINDALPVAQQSLDDQYRAIGRLIGYCITDRIPLLKLHFAKTLYKVICGRVLRYEDLQAVDPIQFQTFDYLLTNNEGDESKYDYIMKEAKNIMIKSIRSRLEQLVMGIYDVIPRQYLSCFDECEMEQIICGSSKINVDNWKSSVLYDGFTSRPLAMIESPMSVDIIAWFWNIVANEFNTVEQCKLVEFVTGLSVVNDFKTLDPLMLIAPSRTSSMEPVAYKE